MPRMSYDGKKGENRRNDDCLAKAPPPPLTFLPIASKRSIFASVKEITDIIKRTCRRGGHKWRDSKDSPRASRRNFHNFLRIFKEIFIIDSRRYFRFPGANVDEGNDKVRISQINKQINTAISYF